MGRVTLGLFTSFGTVLTPFLDGDGVVWLLLRARDLASSHEFTDCFDIFLDGGLRRLESFWGQETLRLLQPVLTLFHCRLASFGGRETFRLLASLPTVLTPFLDGDCVVKLLFCGERETLRLLTSLPTVLTPFWTGIAPFGFFWGETASSHEFSDCFDTFLDGDCVARFFLGGRGTLRLLTSLPTVLTPF